MMPITIISRMLCLMVNRNSRLSSAGVMPVAATATAMLCSEIILPITPAAEFTEAVSTGLMPSALAVTTCRLPNSALADVSLPRQEHAEPAKRRAEERKRPAGRGERQAQRRGHPGIVHQIRQAEHARNRHHRQRQLLEGRPCRCCAN